MLIVDESREIGVFASELFYLINKVLLDEELVRATDLKFGMRVEYILSRNKF